MTEEKKPVEPNVATAGPQERPTMISRRRFTKAGAVAPLVMTLGSRPVWGQTACAASVSGEQSGNASPNVQYAPPGNAGLTATWWQQNPGAWRTDLLGTPFKTSATNSSDVKIRVNGKLYEQSFAIYFATGCAYLSSLLPCATRTSLYSALSEATEKEIAAAALNSLRFNTPDQDYGYSLDELKSFRCNMPVADLACVLEQLNSRSAVSDALSLVVEVEIKQASYSTKSTTTASGAQWTKYPAKGASYASGSQLRIASTFGSSALVIVI